ncbi:hypothetical protein HD554DRAFT_2037707 [Boletus coccyginus]|nr:hypothetical protein HD554DRAFT_2037707 [Boletus coccyginus]
MQKHCTTAQKDAHEAHEAIAAVKAQDQNTKQQHKKILAIAALEDQLHCKDDKDSMYRTATSTRKSANAKFPEMAQECEMNCLIGSEGNEIGPGEDMLTNPATDSTSDHMSDADGPKQLCAQAGYKALHSKGHALHRTYTMVHFDDKSEGDDGKEGIMSSPSRKRLVPMDQKPHGLHEAIGEARKTTSASNVTQKWPVSPADSEPVVNELWVPAPKRPKKAAPFTSNLLKDWKKKGSQLKSVDEKKAMNAPCTLLIPTQMKKADRQSVKVFKQHVAFKKAKEESQERSDGNKDISREPVSVGQYIWLGEWSSRCDQVSIDQKIYFKVPEYIKDWMAQTMFVKSQVSYIHDGDEKAMFPLIYKDSKYAMSAANLNVNKWKKIISLVQKILIADLTATNLDAFQSDGLTKEDDYLNSARALIGVLDSENEDMTTGENAKDENVSTGENAEDEDVNMDNTVDVVGSIGKNAGDEETSNIEDKDIESHNEG